jgi:Tfp pilus assembly protein PilE
MVARSSPSRSFTLVELITAIAILAALGVMAIFFIGNYVTDSKRTADRITLATLNDALTRYKTQGGDINAFTSLAPISHVLAKLQEPITWAGMTHNVMQAGTTFAGKSLAALGDRAQYRFTRYNTYSGEAGGLSPGDLGPSGGNLVGWWKLDQTNGANDLAGSNNGSALSGLTFGTVADHKGNTNGATSFTPASSQSVVLSSNPSLLSASPFTVTAWVMLGASSIGQCLYCTTNDGGFTFGQTNSRPYLAVYIGGAQFGKISTTVLPSNTWLHLAGAWDGSAVTLYLNGAQIANPGGVGHGVQGGSYIGKNGQWGSGYWDGNIGDVRIYNRALTASEISQLYNQ